MKTLEDIEARKPKVVVPSHMAPNQPTDASAVTFTREYLMAFEQELVQAKDGAGLIEAMKGDILKQVSALRLRSVPRLPRAR